VYLSDLVPFLAVNGWGPFEKDRSNGDWGPNDGRPISIQGVTYAKGVGVHAVSDMRYRLDRKYRTFTAVAGIDDEVAGSSASVVFEVWADGIKLYDSGVVRSATAAKHVSINVTGRLELWLVVRNAGDGSNYDHADWADARLIP
jgi:hypothetical protein